MLHLGVYSTKRHKKQFSRLLRLLQDAYLTQSDPGVLRNIMASICFLTSPAHPHPCSATAKGNLRGLAATVCGRLSHYIGQEFSSWRGDASARKTGDEFAGMAQSASDESSARNREFAISLWMRRLRYIALQNDVATEFMRQQYPRGHGSPDSLEKSLVCFLRRRVSKQLLHDIDNGIVTVIGGDHSTANISRKQAVAKRVANPSAAADALQILTMHLFWHGQDLEETATRGIESDDAMEAQKRNAIPHIGHALYSEMNEKRDVVLKHVGAVFEAARSSGEHSKAALSYLDILKTNVRFVVGNMRLFLSQRLRFYNTRLRTLSWNPTEYQLMHLLNQFHVAMEHLEGCAIQEEGNAPEKIVSANHCSWVTRSGDAAEDMARSGEGLRLERRNAVVLPFASVAISGNSPPTMREGSALLQYIKIDYDTTTRQLLKIANRRINDRSGTRNHIKMQLLSLKHIFRYAMSQEHDGKRREREIVAVVKLARNFSRYYSAKMLLGNYSTERKRSLYFSIVDVVRAGMMFALSPDGVGDSPNVRFLEVVCQYLKLIFNDSLLVDTEYKGEAMVQEFWLALEEKYVSDGHFEVGSVGQKAVAVFKACIFRGRKKNKRQQSKSRELS